MAAAFGNCWNIQVAIGGGGGDGIVVVGFGAKKSCRVGCADGCQEKSEGDGSERHNVYGYVTQNFGSNI